MNKQSIYIYRGRSCGKTMIQAEYYKSLVEAGYNVVLMPPRSTRDPKGSVRGVTLRGVIVDKDILTPAQLERAERILSEILKK